MLKFFHHLFDEHARTLKRYQKIVAQINGLEPTIQKLSDAQLQKKTQAFRERIATQTAPFAPDSPELAQAEQRVLREVLPEAFAVVREASRRVLGLRHFDVQLIAGIALHEGTVTEQKTGEGKTLTVTLPLYLNALLGHGVHLVTVNDYLAEIGAGWMGPIYHFLGLRTAVIVHDQAHLYNPDFTNAERGDERLEHFEPITRQDAYACDITYGTNNEYGFDYLRDNMVHRLSDMVQRTERGHVFAIVDEADSILIDEARTPLIISAPDAEPTQQYYEFARLVQSLTKDQDFKVDEKLRAVALTDLGVKRLEQKLGVHNLYEERFDTIHHVEAALKAKTLYQRDKEYIVRDGEVIIVDEHTGRLMYGRRYSDGLHQAIEAKENVKIQQESRTLATISLQNYFRMYEKLSGMSGTAVTESEEFRKIYNMDVLPIPTHVPTVRNDLPDMVYKTTAAKYSAIVREVEERAKTGQPILIGTRSIEHNQIISNFLNRKGITHQVLNAKNHEKEAFIIADAGKKDAITVATNIAGRGVDIVLGGAKPEHKDFRNKPKAYEAALAKWQKAHDQVVTLGGLHIIGSERHESRRIDNQLRGRSGRQGDPGSTQFFLALEDEIMRLFGGNQIAKLMDFLKIEEDQPIEHGMVSKAIESAQVKVEGFFFDQRKRLVEFDDVMNKQREVIYKRRLRILKQSTDEIATLEEKPAKGRGKTSTTTTPSSLSPEQTLRDMVITAIESEIRSVVTARASDSFSSDELDAIVRAFVTIIPFDTASQHELRRGLESLGESNAVMNRLTEIAIQTYQSREDAVSAVHMRNIERTCLLTAIDEQWMDHLDEMDALREGIWLRGDKQMVLSEYKKESYVMFERLIEAIDHTIATRIFRIHVQDEHTLAPATTQAVELKAEEYTNLNEVVAQSPEQHVGSTQKSTPSSTKGSIQDLAAALSGAHAQRAPSPGSAVAKVGRNDPCPCGSGKKFKKCHGKNL